jgi:hypothetical protein
MILLTEDLRPCQVFVLYRTSKVSMMDDTTILCAYSTTTFFSPSETGKSHSEATQDSVSMLRSLLMEIFLDSYF